MSAADIHIDLRGRIALVTGGTGGMGRVTTTELARPALTSSPPAGTTSEETRCAGESRPMWVPTG
jgi:hypothetical protein